MKTENLRDALLRAQETLELLKGTKGAVSLNYRYTVHDTLDHVTAALNETGTDEPPTFEAAHKALLALAEHMTPERGVSALYSAHDVRKYAQATYGKDGAS